MKDNKDENKGKVGAKDDSRERKEGNDIREEIKGSADSRMAPPGEKENMIVGNFSRVIAEFNRMCVESSGFNSLISSRSYGVARRNIYNLMATSGAMLAMLEHLIAIERIDRGLPPIHLLPWEATPVVSPDQKKVNNTVYSWLLKMWTRVSKKAGGRG